MQRPGIFKVPAIIYKKKMPILKKNIIFKGYLWKNSYSEFLKMPRNSQRIFYETIYSNRNDLCRLLCTCRKGCLKGCRS